MSSVKPLEVGETFEDISLEDDVEQATKDAAQNPSRGPNRRRRHLLIGTVVVLVAGAVAAGVAIGLSGSEENESFVVQEEMVFAKSKVDSLCSQENTKSENGQRQCEAVCAPAACCDPFNSVDSCFQNETESCLNYAKCQGVLAVNDTVEPARLDLAQVCSLESIAEDDTQCIDACEEAKCCYTDEFSCAAKEFLMCLDYAPCQNLRNSTYKGLFGTLPVAPPEILETCSPVSKEFDEDKCKEICEPAACCLADALPGDLGCLESNLISCLTYAPCGGVVIPQANKVVPDAPLDLIETCSPEAVLGADRDKCVDACKPADCCSSKDDSCLLDDPLGCLEWAPCGVLLLSGGDVPAPQDNLNDLCSDANIVGGGQALADCVEACEPSFCCAAPSSNCLADNFFTCPQYFPCARLFHVVGDVKLLDSPPDDLKDECSGHRISDKCKDMCEKGAACCFAAGSSNCLLGGNQEVCAQWLTDGCWKVPGFLIG